MAKDTKKVKEDKKPKEKDYHEKLKINGTLDEVLNISVLESTLTKNK